MVGITSYGAYIPIWRLSRDVIAKAWLTRAAGGERSVCNDDEDSITMAVEAGFDCLKGQQREQVDGLYFATTTAPYREKECSTLISTVLDLNDRVRTADFGNSLRSSTTALRAAMDAVKAGSASNIIIAAADCRVGMPKSEAERAFGDGAAAVIVGKSKVIAEIEGVYSISDEITDVWRKDSDKFVNFWEDRWIIGYGYTDNMRKAISGLLKQQGIAAKDITKAVFYGPEARAIQGLAEGLGFNTKTQMADSLLQNVGNTGAAHPLLVLCAALEDAKPGDRLLLASYGGGADALLLRVTDEILQAQVHNGTKVNISSKRMIPSYEIYLAYRHLITIPQELVRLTPSATVMWRTENWVLRGHASKCRKCGVTTFPIQRICVNCRSKDDYDEVRISDKKGKVFTFSLDNMAGGIVPPTPQTIVESDETKARIYSLMTDCEPKEVKIGMPVELTFRKFHEGGGFHNYFWKCRPVRGGQ